MENFLIAARFVHYAAAITLAGGCAFLCLVAGPAFRRTATDPATAVGLRRRCLGLGWASLLLTLVSGVAWMMAVAAAMSGEPLAALWSQGVLVTVLTETRFGEVWLLRLGLAISLGFCLLLQYRAREWTSCVAAWAAVAFAAALLASLAWAGHGAATPDGPGKLHFAADIVHLLAAGLWLGTLPPLALLLAEARRIGGAGWTAIGCAATRRFSTVAIASVAVLFVAGLVNTWFLAGTVPALVGTLYGRLLLAKIAMFLVMVLIAAVNLFRLTPRLEVPSRAVAATLGQLRRNAWIEAAIGLAVLAVVAVLGIQAPGLHTEPGWPLPFRIDTAALGARATIALALLALIFAVCLVAAVIRAATGHYRRTLLPLCGLVLSLAVAWLPLRAAVEPAYPTTFYAPAEPYATPSVARGMRLYAANCALCHGVSGKGDGPAAASLPIRPADLLAPHLFAHAPGDLFWWIGHGRANGVMPGFAAILSPAQRWDLVDFIRARAAGALSQLQGPAITTAAAYPVPDFAFERDGQQQTLSTLLKSGPVLLVLYRPPAPVAALARLAAARQKLAAAGLAVVAVELGGGGAPELPPPGVEVAGDVAASLALFMPAGAKGASALMLDRAGNVRARWTAESPGGLPDPAVLAAAAARVARFPAAAPSHAGHAG